MQWFKISVKEIASANPFKKCCNKSFFELSKLIKKKPYCLKFKGIDLGVVSVQ